MPRRARASVVARLVLSIGLLIVAVLVLLNRQTILDQITVWRYTPSPAIAAMAERASMSPQGRFLFFASIPELLERDSFNEACRSTATEHAAILGCYASGRIYLFNISNEQLDGVKEVTAAHEMLHAAYERLSPPEKARVDGLLERQELGAQKERIDALMVEYDKSEPGQRLNELHSIIGTEVTQLDPELAAYYDQYFDDRAALTTLAQKYQAVFEQLEARQDSLVDELNRLAGSIDSDSAAYRRAIAALSDDVSSFNRRASSGNMTRETYDREREDLLARQARLRTTYDRIQRQIDEYETIRTELTSINSQSEALNRSINSSLPSPGEQIGG